MTYLIDGCLFTKVSSKSGRGSKPPRPTKTCRPSVLACSAAVATFATSE